MLQMIIQLKVLVLLMKYSENLTLVAGFHEGMTPMFGADPEEADNTELGIRYKDGAGEVEIFYFSSEYSNLAAERYSCKQGCM